MNHDTLKDLLIDYHDDTLSEKDRQTVQEHLRSCVHCRAELDSIENLMNRLKAQKLSDPGEAFWDEFTKKVEKEYFGEEKEKVVDLSAKRIEKPSRGFTPARFAYAAVIAMAFIFATWTALNIINHRGKDTIGGIDQVALMEEMYTSTELETQLASIDEISSGDLDKVSDSITIEIESDDEALLAQDLDAEIISSYEESVGYQLAQMDSEQLELLYERLQILETTTEAREG